mgnify:CR=1 FL=1
MSKHISLASYELEAAARAEGYAHVCGADEAGAGPLMGPVYATAVILPEGCVIEEIEVRCEELCGKMRQHFMVDDLKFLRKGGRLSGAAAFAGTLLQIKPILQGDPEGKIVVLSKERGRKKAMDTLSLIHI